MTDARREPDLNPPQRDLPLTARVRGAMTGRGLPLLNRTAVAIALTALVAIAVVIKVALS